MPRPIWKGSISFGLVTIPVQVLSATSSAEKISFRMLRKTDLSPIKYKRVAEVDGKEVANEEIVKGYEFEKGRFVTLDDSDFDKVELESVDSIAIHEFVDLADINPIFFDKPYYLEPLKGGADAYGLLRDVLADLKKVGIAKVAMRGRQHLAALKADGPLLVLELMHFAKEIAPTDEVKVPPSKAGAREFQMAKSLVEHMSGEWEPEKYTDEYAEAVMKLIDQKLKTGGKEVPAPHRRAAEATNVIDLVDVLAKSLQSSRVKTAPSKTKAEGARAGSKRGTRRIHGEVAS